MQRNVLNKYLWLLPVVLAFAWAKWNGYAGLSDQDAHDYLRVAKAWQEWSQGGSMPPATEHPQVYPMLGAFLGSLIGDVLWAMRLITLLSFVLLGWCISWLLRRVHPGDPRVPAFALLTIGASPFLLRHALVVMTDLPAMALIVLAYVFVVRAMAEHRWPFVLWACLAAALAMVIRSATVPVVLVLLVYPILSAAGRRTRVAFFISLLVFAAAYFLIPADGLHHLLRGSPLADWSPINWFRRELRSDDGVLSYRFPNLIYVCSAAVHPGLLPIGALLIPFVRRDDLRPVHARMSLCVAAGYLLFIAGMPFQNDRVLMLAQPFIVIPLFPAFTRAWAWLEKRSLRPHWLITGLVIVQMGLFARAIQPFIQKARTEREVARVIKELHPQHVYTHGMGGAINTYCPGIAVTELWYERMDRFEPGALVIIRPQGLEEQWRGFPPADNWHRMQQIGVERLALLPEGWELYRLR